MGKNMDQIAVASAVGLLLLLPMIVVQRCAADQPDRCSLEPDKGPCTNFEPFAFFNSTSGKCEWFVYGGCEGNDNRFASEDECQAECGEGGSGTRCLMTLPPAGDQAERCLFMMTL